MFGIHNGAVGHGGTAADRRLTGCPRDFTDIVDDNCFHNIFRKAGMHTASVSTFPERHSSWWFNAGFNECYNVGGHGNESGEEVLPVALDWLRRNRERDNWFLHVHFWDPHTQRSTVPLPGAGKLWQSLCGGAFGQLDRRGGPGGAQEGGGPPTASTSWGCTPTKSPRATPRMPGSAQDMAGLRRVMDGYDTGILYADYLVGQLLRLAERTGPLRGHGPFSSPRTHGENMGELAIYSEHGTADYPTCHIPFIMKSARLQGGLGGQRAPLQPGFAAHHGPAAGGGALGEVGRPKALPPAVTEGKAAGREYLVLSQMAHVCQRSARFGDWIYIRTLHDGYHLFDREMLFNVKEDPHEQRDVKALHPEVCAQGAKLILDWQEEQMLKSPSPVDPMYTVLHEGGPYHTRGHLQEYALRLEQTGRRSRRPRAAPAASQRAISKPGKPRASRAFPFAATWGAAY